MATADTKSFNQMVEDVQLVDDHVLLAKLRNGHWSRLDLDECLGNEDGACSKSLHCLARLLSQ